MALEKVATAYKYTFYKLYRWSQAVNGESRYHEIHAVIMLSLTVAMFIFALLGLMNLISISPISPQAISNSSDEDVAIFSVIFSAIVFSLNLYLLKYRIGFDKVVKEYESEGERSRKIGGILVTCYVIASFILPISIWFFIALRNS